MGGVSDFGEYARARPTSSSPRNNKSTNTRPGGIAVKWDKVVIGDIWGPGKSHLTPPGGGDLQFRLLPRYLRDANGKSYVANYAIDFSKGQAPDEWAGAIFTPMGTAAVTGISGLPDWKKSDPAVCKRYQDAIDDTSKNNLGSGSTERLE